MQTAITPDFSAPFASGSPRTRLMPTRPSQVNFRISEDGLNLLYALQEHFGLSQAGIFEMLLRDKAREEGITLKDARRLGMNRGENRK